MHLSDGREFQIWTEVVELQSEWITFVHHYRFSDFEAEMRSRSTLRFRPETTLRATLESCGFEIEAIHGGWQREPVGYGDGEFIVIARATK